MFQNKHIIRASFISLFLSILASIFFYRYFTINNIIVESVIKENNRITQYYTDNIWEKYVHTAGLNEFSNLSNALNNINFKEFATSSIQYLKDQHSPKITIFNAQGIELLSTNINDLSDSPPTNLLNMIDMKIDTLFIKKYDFREGVEKALKGTLNYNITFGSSLDKQNDQLIYTQAFIPILDKEDPHVINGLIYFANDITEEWNKIKYFEKRVSIFLLVVFSLFFGIIVFNTQHAQKIIDQQVANNKFLEEAKLKAESESTAKTEFLANVSHELRTPLNAIIGFSEVILTEAYGKLEHPQYSEYIQDINNSGKHLLSVINDILDFSKASADKLKVDIIDVDATKLSSSSLRFVKPRADEAKVQLIEKLPKEHIVIKADPKRLKQALLNLLSNSVKFTPENGSVTLELERNVEDKVVNIRVIDTGIGMEEKDIPKALASFGQIDNKLSRKYEGTGLGLPLTKKLVELMNGKFEITSKLGIGTTVTISFKYEDF